MEEDKLSDWRNFVDDEEGDKTLEEMRERRKSYAFVYLYYVVYYGVSSRLINFGPFDLSLLLSSKVESLP